MPILDTASRQFRATAWALGMATVALGAVGVWLALEGQVLWATCSLSAAAASAVWARALIRRVSSPVASGAPDADETPAPQTSAPDPPDPEAAFVQRSLESPSTPWTFRDDWRSGRMVGSSTAGDAVVVLEVIAQLGTRLAGRVQTALEAVPEPGVEIALECVAQRRSDLEEDDQEPDDDIVLWATSIQAHADLGPGGRVEVPFSIPIPRDAMSPLGLSPHPTTVLSPAEMAAASRRILWRLVLEAADYRAHIEVPVFAATCDLEAAARKPSKATSLQA